MSSGGTELGQKGRWILTLFFSLLMHPSIHARAERLYFAEDPHCCCSDAIPPLRELMQLTGVQVPEDHGLRPVTAAVVQSEWLSKQHLERWDMDLPTHLKSDPLKVQKIAHLCFDKLGLGAAVLPHAKSYDAVLFLGASINMVLSRLQFYVHLVESGQLARATPLWVLTGERRLSPAAGETREKLKSLLNPGESTQALPHNEVEMMKFVLQRRLPADFPKPVFIESPRDTLSQRATTASTVKTFLQHWPKGQKGRLLAISSQPYVAYQQTVLDFVLRQQKITSLEAEVVGKAFDGPRTSRYAANCLDAVAKVLKNQLTD